MNNNYRANTIQVLSLIASEAVKVTHDKKRRVIVFSRNDEAMEMADKDSRCAMLLNDILNGGEYVYDYKCAEDMGISPQELSMYVSTTSPRDMPRNKVLILILMDPDAPSADDVDHILLELRKPGLFVTTYNMAENKRNAVIRLALEFFFENEKYKGIERARFLNSLLYHLEGEIGLPRKQLLLNSTWGITGVNEPELVEKCREELARVGATSFQGKRTEFRSRYKRKYGIDSVSVFNRRLIREFGLSDGTLRSFFGNASIANSRCSRDTVINIAIAMECSFDEVNTLLLEANHALLYPNGYYDDVQYINKIMAASEDD